MRVARWPALAVLALAVSVGTTACGAPPKSLDAEVKARVDALLVRMSLEEKIGQLNQVGA